MSIDLHTHTTFSDGTFSPKELVKYACEKGLNAIAVTDHDTTDGVAEAMSATENIPLEVIPGIELSSMYEDKEIHIVGLFIDPNDKILKSELEGLRKSREERNVLMAEKLTEKGLPITYEEVFSFSGGSIITRAHFAGVLVEKGFVTSVNEAFTRFLGDGCPCYIQRSLPSAEKSIDMILKNGGLAVLAHPLLYKMGNEHLEHMINRLAEKGLAAIEAYYSTHSPSDTKRICELAEKNSLLLSGGSDFHGSNKKGLDLGCGYGNLDVPNELLVKLKGAKKNGKRNY